MMSVMISSAVTVFYHKEVKLYKQLSLNKAECPR
jgi:hypothetical protein